MALIEEVSSIKISTATLNPQFATKKGKNFEVTLVTPQETLSLLWQLKQSFSSWN